MQLIGEVISSTKYDNKNRLKEILYEEKSGWDMTAFDRGHILTMLRLSSYFSETGKVAEKSGLAYYYFLSNLISHFDDEYETLVKKLRDLSAKIFTKANLCIHTTGLDGEQVSLKNTLPILLDVLPDGEIKDFTPWTFHDAEINEAFLTSGKVQYVTKGSNFKTHGFNYTGAIPVMETILRYEYLLSLIHISEPTRPY